MDADDMSDLARLRASLRDKHEQLAGCGAEPGSGRYSQMAEEILDATERLLNSEAAAAAAAAHRRHAGGARSIRYAGAVTAAVLLVITIIYLGAGWASPLWLLLLVPVMLGAAGMALFEPAGPAGDQGIRGGAAVLLATAGLLTILAVTRAVPGWMAALAAVSAVAAGAAWTAGMAWTAGAADAGGSTGGPEQAAR